MSHSQAGEGGQISPPRTPQSQRTELHRPSGGPSSSTRAVPPHEARYQAFVAEWEEQARAESNVYINDPYPQPSGPPSQPHVFHTYPPVLFPGSPSSASQKQAMSNEQLGMLLTAAQKRKGHQFGPINLDGNGSILAGNTFDDKSYVRFLPDHRFQQDTAYKGWSGALLRGEQHIDIARDFLASPSKYQPPPPSRSGSMLNYHHLPESVHLSQRANHHKQSAIDTIAIHGDCQKPSFVNDSTPFQRIAEDIPLTRTDSHQAKRLKRLPVPPDHAIADSTAQCNASFCQLLDRSQTRETNLASEVRPDLWQDLLGRLRIWTANFSADQHDHTSLDFHLRDATHLKIEIVALLGELHQLLTEVVVYLEQREGSEAKIDSEMSDSDESTSDDTTTYQGFYNSALVQIDCLFEMSLSISSHAKLDRIIGLDLTDVSQYWIQDLAYIQQKFPYASPSIKDKLVRATAIRRATLNRYQQRSAHATSMLPEPAEVTAEKKGERSETNTTGSHDNSISIPHDIRSLIDPNRNPHIPIPLALGSGRPYRCPYCYYCINFHDKTTFVQHVLEDITPYQCLFETCTKSLQLFAERGVWLSHMRSKHQEELMGERRRGVCQLCDRRHRVLRPVEGHLAQHLEDLAMYVLPSLDADQGTNKSSDMKITVLPIRWSEPRRDPSTELSDDKAQREAVEPFLQKSKSASRKPSEYSSWIDGLAKSSSEAEQSREANFFERLGMENFNKHVEDCESCGKALSELTTLCSRGTEYAKCLGDNLYHKAGKSYAKFDRDYSHQTTKVLIPQALKHVSDLFGAISRGHFQGLIAPLEGSMTQPMQSDPLARNRWNDIFSSKIDRKLYAGLPEDVDDLLQEHVSNPHGRVDIHRPTVTPRNQGKNFRRNLDDVAISSCEEDNGQ